MPSQRNITRGKGDVESPQAERRNRRRGTGRRCGTGRNGIAPLPCGGLARRPIDQRLVPASVFDAEEIGELAGREDRDAAILAQVEQVAIARNDAIGTGSTGGLQDSVVLGVTAGRYWLAWHHQFGPEGDEDCEAPVRPLRRSPARPAYHRPPGSYGRLLVIGPWRRRNARARHGCAEQSCAPEGTAASHRPAPGTGAPGARQAVRRPGSTCTPGARLPGDAAQLAVAS